MQPGSSGATERAAALDPRRHHQRQPGAAVRRAAAAAAGRGCRSRASAAPSRRRPARLRWPCRGAAAAHRLGSATCSCASAQSADFRSSARSTAAAAAAARRRVFDERDGTRLDSLAARRPRPRARVCGFGRRAASGDVRACLPRTRRSIAAHADMTSRSSHRAHSVNDTGTPGSTSPASSSASQLVSRTQPCEPVLSIFVGSGVPWMP